MIEVTYRAVNMLMDTLEKIDWEKKVRLCMVETETGEKELGIMLDDSRETDIVETIDGITFIVDRDFYEKGRPFYVDFIPRNPGAGFRMASRLNKEALYLLIKGIPDKEKEIRALAESLP